MNKVFSVIGKFIFTAFVVAIALWTASLTLAEMRAILPNDPMTPYFALALFDGGAVAWLAAWLTYARGIYQRAIAIFLLAVDLLGIVLLSAGRLLMGGQTLTEAPQHLGGLVVYGVVIATLLNLVAVYAFHITNPDTIEEIETAILEDTLREEALQQAKASIESEAQALGAVLAARATGRLKYKLRLPVGTIEAQALEHEIMQEAAQQPRQIIPQILERPVIMRPREARRPGPLARWIAGAAGKIRDAFTINQPREIVTYESATAGPQKIEPQPMPTEPSANLRKVEPATDQPANLPLEPAADQPAEQPAGGDANFTKPDQGEKQQESE